MRKIAPTTLLVVAFIFMVSACAKASDQAGKVVESYLTALVNKDKSSISAISCADWEQSALLELDSLQAVTARLQDVKCATTDTEGIISYVDCQGKIIATYSNEDQELDLSARTYRVELQGSEYLMCGYK